MLINISQSIISLKVTGVNYYNLKNKLHGLIILENIRMNRIVPRMSAISYMLNKFIMNCQEKYII